MAAESPGEMRPLRVLRPVTETPPPLTPDDSSHAGNDENKISK